jgi:hypothetical protein
MSVLENVLIHTVCVVFSFLNENETSEKEEDDRMICCRKTRSFAPLRFREERETEKSSGREQLPANDTECGASKAAMKSLTNARASCSVSFDIPTAIIKLPPLLPLASAHQSFSLSLPLVFFAAT